MYCLRRCLCVERYVGTRTCAHVYRIIRWVICLPSSLSAVCYKWKWKPTVFKERFPSDDLNAILQYEEKN